MKLLKLNYYLFMTGILLKLSSFSNKAFIKAELYHLKSLALYKTIYGHDPL